MATLIACAAAYAQANLIYWDLASQGNLMQNWTDPDLITEHNNWSNVPSITGYAGSDPTIIGFPDPQTILQDFTDEHVMANLDPFPGASGGGGCGEFDQILEPVFTDRVVALQGLATADVPHLRFRVNATGLSDIHIRYTLRDIDDSPDNVQSQVALHYRIGGTGNWINVPSAFVPDASSPNTAIRRTDVNATLSAWNNQELLEFRVMLANAQGQDEWIGVDDIEIGVVPEPSTIAALVFGAIVFVKRRSRR